MEGASPSGHSAGCGVSDAPPRELAARPGGAKDAWRHLGMYSFQIERIHPPDPRRKIQGGFRISPLTTPLKRPKEGLWPFLWKPSRGLRGISGKRARALRRALTGDVETWDERWRLWCLRSFRTPRLVGDEGDDGPADLKPALGIYRLSPLRIPRISVGGGLRPAPPGIAGYSDASVGRGDHTPPNPRPQGSLV